MFYELYLLFTSLFISLAAGNPRFEFQFCHLEAPFLLWALISSTVKAEESH